ncbi:hypothetical protein [Microcystis sp.]
MSIIRIFLNKKIENFKEAQTIDRYSFERINPLRGHQKKGKWAAPEFCGKLIEPMLSIATFFKLFLSFGSPYSTINFLKKLNLTLGINALRLSRKVSHLSLGVAPLLLQQNFC